MTRAPDLDAIRRRRASATSNLHHWHVENGWRGRWVFGNPSVSVDDMSEADAAFHAHAPEDIDALITENERLTRELAAARALVSEYFEANSALNATHHARVMARSMDAIDAALAAHNAALARFDAADRALRALVTPCGDPRAAEVDHREVPGE